MLIPVRMGWALALAGLWLCACGSESKEDEVDGDESPANPDDNDPDDPSSPEQNPPKEPDAPVVPEHCEGVRIADDGVLDGDLAVVRVSGKITLHGETLPELEYGRGALTFISDDGTSVASTSLGTTGEGTYALLLPPAHYRVDYVPSGSSCGELAEVGLPCVGTTLRSIELREDGVLDADLSSVTVSGNVTLSGGPFADLSDISESRGSVTFRARDGQLVASVPLTESGAASYRVSLPQGTYDVLYAGNPASCVGSEVGRPPCNGYVVKTNVKVSDDAVLDLNVESVTIAGHVTLADKAMSGTGSVRFVPEGAAEGASEATAALIGDESASYVVRVVPGTYAMHYAPDLFECEGASPTSPPCNDVLLHEAVKVDSDGTIDANLRAVDLAGDVTLNGGPLPGDTFDLGVIVLTDSASGVAISRAIDADQRYAFRVSPGTYDVSYAPAFGVCDASALPCNGGVLHKGVRVSESGVLDLDIPSVAITGRVTLEGEPLPDEQADRGSLTFVPREGSAAGTDHFGTVGAFDYAVHLMPGTYDVRLTPYVYSDCFGGGSAKVPCIGGTLITGADLTQSGNLDVDIKAVQLSGHVTLHGDALPEGDVRGFLSLVGIAPTNPEADSAGDAALQLPWLSSGEASYRAVILPGNYVLSHGPSTSCSESLETGMPCAAQILWGCD